MTKKIFTSFTAFLASMCVMLLSQTSAFAAEKKMEEITVIAPRITSEQRTSPPYGKVIVAHERAVVDISDLDIAKSADMNKVEERVEKAARRLCNNLEEELPFGQPDTYECTRRAVDDAMAQVREVVSQ